MSQAQMGAGMATLQANNDVLRRTQDYQQAFSNAQIISSMAFSADAMKQFQPNSNDQ